MAERWRSKSGEIDLALRSATTLIFCEVKKSRTFGNAALALSERQQLRIRKTALDYLAEHDLSLDTDCRFDLAMVDETGQIDILENAF